jgi:acetylornithine/succinyldiaminopimelate/putrescine aminotransferase
MADRHLLYETWDQLLSEQIPNFLRLSIQPSVVKTCYCLSEYVRTTWYPDCPSSSDFQSFLANSFDEALSGAIKLARYCADLDRRPRTGLIFDPTDRLGTFLGVSVGAEGKVEFVPDIESKGSRDQRESETPWDSNRFGFVVLLPSDQPKHVQLLRSLTQQTSGMTIIACIDRTSLSLCRADSGFWGDAPRPSIVVFDESFVRKQVPFGAFTASCRLYRHWNKPGLANFHSTTYQPNAVSTLHFLNCLHEDDPPFLERSSAQLKRIDHDASYRKQLFAQLYSPAQARAAAAVGWDRKLVGASGHYITVADRPVFDAVAGVACSIRGHNPPGYTEELRKLANIGDYHAALTDRLNGLTGLPHLVPAVSGASAVESALRLGLTAEFPRTYVLAFRGGFGGKTLLALTGTSHSSYKRRIEPLYPNVVYIDPFKPNAIDDAEAALRAFPVGVVQLELVQAVGGVRALPEKLLLYLQEAKERFGYSLFVDEVQTGMYRTGPFLRSAELGLAPDLVTIGKGSSDMMFPFGATLYSDRVGQLLASKGKSDLPNALRRQHDYEFGYKTFLNVLDRAEEQGLPKRVRHVGGLIEERLTSALANCRVVREIRAFGLLIAIELDVGRGLRKWLGNQVGRAYILRMLHHKTFPVLVGYCQYEPHVLKLTPPLSITDSEAERLCDSIADVIDDSTLALLPPLLKAFTKSIL